MKLKTTIYRQSGEFVQNDSLDNISTIQDVVNVIVEQNRGDVIVYQNDNVLIVKQKNTIIKYEKLD
jgi:hypothetical protein